ncbi:MAG: hypothetical protein A2Z20_00090 [Bdellovibrionales bacterium RBG_16_40_8]|nr:MAG: hypothetical protein A2Z20_00090 [Bdellovibrionales bacterium RBG_16_40_8]
MKSITEFQTHKLVKAIEAKTALAAEGKTPEEIQQNLGATFKLEGDKLKFFFNALDVAAQNIEKLSRILVVSLAEGENAPHKAIKIEEHHYIPDFQVEARQPILEKPTKGARPGQGKGKKSGPKSSPWGMSPEEKASKKASSAAKAKAE